MQLKRSGRLTCLAVCASFAWSSSLCFGIAVGRNGAGGSGTRELPPPALRVDFALHGSDWTEGSCASRKSQSPVNLNEMSRPADDFFTFLYGSGMPASQSMLTNDGRVLSVDVSAAGLGGLALPASSGGAEWYPLERIDVHASSEHTLRGQHAPLELQLIHRAPTGSTAGHELVAVSVLVDCEYPPAIPQTPPPLTDAERADEPFMAELQVRQNEIAGKRDLGHAHGLSLRGHQEHKVVPVGYQIPPTTDVGFNPLLQPFLVQEPPVIDDEVAIEVPTSVGLQGLGGLLMGGSFFMYRGSETLPPCDERVVWLVRRERVRASDAQVKALFDRLYLTSNNAGNFRTVMPMNQRDVLVLVARERNSSISTTEHMPAVTVDTAAVSSAVLGAQAAATAATAGAHGLATRVQSHEALKAQQAAAAAAALEAEKVKAIDDIKAQIKQEVVNQVLPATRDLTRTYVMRELLHQVGGFHKL